MTESFKITGNQEDKLEDYSALAYGKFMSKNMLPFDEYMNTLISVGNIQEKTDDIVFHMNQLMDLYIIHCKLLEKWIEVTTKKNRIKIFKVFIDLYLMDYFWMYLRIFPNPDCANCVGKISTDIGILTIVDFIDVDIFEINPVFMKERKITLSQKLSKTTIECLDNYRQLAQLLANQVAEHSSGTVINQILNNYSIINI